MKKPTKEQISKYSIKIILTIPALCLGLLSAFVQLLKLLRLLGPIMLILNPVVILWMGQPQGEEDGKTKE